MISPPEFSSLIVSRPRSRSRWIQCLRGFALAGAFYAVGVVLLVLAPFLMLEVMSPPRADVRPVIDLVFRTPGGHGDNRRAGRIRRGSRDGRRSSVTSPAPHTAQSRAVARPSSPVAPPAETEIVPSQLPGEGNSGNEDSIGDPIGTGDDDVGTPGGCPGCTGRGPSGPEGPDEPYYEGTEGLVPPSLLPGTRVLPNYPDAARRAALQGTVILLAVVQADGTIGEIQVLRSPDQRWGFDLKAIEAVKQWRYQPALMNGKPVGAYIQVLIEFTVAR